MKKFAVKYSRILVNSPTMQRHTFSDGNASPQGPPSPESDVESSTQGLLPSDVAVESGSS
eukprot:m.41031 g.41031  ORF g.41031 m.41031 type:complete len:60 (-) comp6971_c1_seq2:1055-1234(-)